MTIFCSLPSFVTALLLSSLISLPSSLAAVMVEVVWVVGEVWW
jgi:hypothetical protein